jgi:hypothetical protein
MEVRLTAAIPVLTVMSHLLHDSVTAKLKKDYSVDKIFSASA